MSSLGRFEYELLRFLCNQPKRSVREIYDDFGKPGGLVRGTIVKAMDRLMKKGLVDRELSGGLFRYSSVATAEQLEKDLVDSFVRDRLGGSIAPLASYLAEARTLSRTEAEALQHILEREPDSE